MFVSCLFLQKMACGLCGKENIARDALQRHERQECPEVVVACPFAAHGCKVGWENSLLAVLLSPHLDKAEKTKRFELEAHMAASASQHLTLLLDRAEEQARLLKDALRIRDLRIAELEQKVRHLQETKTENVVCQVLFFVFRACVSQDD